MAMAQAMVRSVYPPGRPWAVSLRNEKREWVCGETIQWQDDERFRTPPEPEPTFMGEGI
jgi:hypothetical protein